MTMQDEVQADQAANEDARDVRARNGATGSRETLDRNARESAAIDERIADERALERDVMAESRRALVALQAPFPAEQVGKLPKQVRRDDQDRYRCEPSQGRKVSMDGSFCGGYHALSVHLDYVGHAALTKRLLDVDPFWNWEPVGTDEHGFPLFDRSGGLWIRLTVAGMTRLGYGDAGGKSGNGNAIKEAIGDALRNAGLRFGAAIDLWSKEDLRSNEIERGDHDGPAPASAVGETPAARPAAQGGNGPETSAQPSTIDEEVRSGWRQRILSIEYLGNKPKEKGPDGGLRTAYVDAQRAGILAWPLAPNGEETFLQILQRLSRELPEWPDESKDEVPAGETDEQRVEREILEREREAIRQHEQAEGLGRATDDGAPAVLGNGWGEDPGAGWGQPTPETPGNGHTR